MTRLLCGTSLTAAAALASGVSLVALAGIAEAQEITVPPGGISGTAGSAGTNGAIGTRGDDGGIGVDLQAPNTGLTNDYSITGGAGGRGGNSAGQVGASGGAGGTAVRSNVAGAVLQNSGSITGGRGGDGGTGGNGGPGGAGGQAGAGVILLAPSTLTNAGTISGGLGGTRGSPGTASPNGLGGVGLTASGGTTIINAGAISGGLPGGGGTTRANAISFTGGNNRLELRSSSVITGNVVATAGGGDTLALGGDSNGSFNSASIGASAQYRNFSAFEKSGASIWTLTGTTTASTAWRVTAGVLSVASDASLGSNAGGLTLDGGTLSTTANITMSRAVALGSGNGAIDVAAGTTLTQQGLVSGVGALTKAGSGTLTLTGANTYQGGTLISGGGTVQITSDANLGDPTGGITFDNGTLQVQAPIVSNRDITLAGAGIINTDTSLNATTAWTVGGDITGPGSLTKTGLGGLILTGDATHTGGTTVSQGVLQIGDGGTAGSIAGDIVNNTGVIFNRSDSYTYGGSITGSGSLSVDEGTLTLTGNSIIGGNITAQPGAELRITAGNRVSTTGNSATANGGILTVAGAGSTLEASRVFANSSGANGAVINVENGGTIRATAAGLTLRSSGGSTALVSLNVSGAGSLVDLAAGPLTVATTQPAAASVTVSNGGTVRSAGANVIGAATGNTTAPIVAITGAGSNWTSIGGTLTMTNGELSVLDGGAASFASASIGTATAGTAATLVSGTNSTFATTGNLVIGDSTGTGVMRLTDGGRLTVGGIFTLANAAGSTGTLNIGGAMGPAAAGVLDATTLSFGAGFGSLIFNHTETDYGFATAVSGAGIIRQVAGVTRLTADNSGFTGSTAISGGTLLVNGTLGSAASTVNVLGGGTLGGSGTIGGDVFVGGGSVLAPGNSPGTLTINGNLSFSPNAVLAFEFGQANVVGGPLNDLINVGGDLTLDGTLEVTVTPGGEFGVGVYRVVNYGGTLTDNGLTVDPGYFVQTSVANQVNLVNTAGLTMRFWDGANGVKNDGVITGGDGLWQNSGGNDNWTEYDGSANAPFTDDAFAVFSGVGGTVTVDDSLGDITASGMQFTSDGYSLAGAGVSLVAPQAVIRVGDGTANGAAYTATIASNLTGIGDLIKSDLGTLVLTGANSFAGDAGVRGGELRLADGGTITSVNGIVGIEAGDGAIMTVAASDGSGNASTWTVGADLSVGYGGNGTLNVIDGGRVISSSGQVGLDSDGFGRVLVSGTDSSWENSGRISVGLFGAGALRIENGAMVTSNDGVVGGSEQGEVVVSGPGAAWTNAQQLSVGSFGAGTMRIEDGASVISNQGYIGANAAGSVTVTGPGSNWLVTDFSMTVGNAGTGALAIDDGGRVRAEAGVSLGVAGGSGATVELLGTPGNRGVLETSRISAGLGTVNLTIDGGLLRATQDQANLLTGFGARAVMLGANGGVIDTDGHDIGISPRFTGGGGLIKEGLGTLTLTGANAYAGVTLVNAGTLLVNGDQSAAMGLTTIFSGATLGGNGIIGGNVDMQDGAILAPGAGIGTLTINGNLSLADGSTLNYEFGQADVAGGALNDLVDIGGNLTLDGTLNVTVPTGGSFGPGIYRVFNYGGELVDNGLEIGTMPGGADLFVQTSVANQVNLINVGGALLNFWDGSLGANKFDNVVNGGSGMWRTGLDNSWTEATGALNAGYANGAFAIFAGIGGVVTIDNSLGAVTASGLQFATTNYRVQGGALTLTGPQSVIRVGDGTTAGLGYSVIITSEITGSAQLVKTDLGRLVLAGVNSYTGGTALNGGTVRISSDANLGAASGGLSFNGGTLNTTADISSGRSVDLAGQGVLSINGDTTLALTGNLTGAGLIGKLGAGTLVLAGTGSHSGGMEVVQGALFVNGDYSAATGRVTMNQLTTLGGTGTIGGTVNLSGTLAPGVGGAGTLTIGGDLIISPAATLDFEFGEAGVVGGTLNDLVNVGGDLVLDGVLNVGVPTGGAFDVGVYRMFNYGGTLTDNGVTLGTMPTGSNAQVQTSIAGQVNLVNSAGLALNFWDGAAGPKNDGVINGGNGVWQGSAGNNNWTDATGNPSAPYANGGFAIFGGTAGTVTIDNGPGAVSATGMQFAANGYVVTGDALTLDGVQAVVRVGDGSTAGAGFTATINSTLTGTAQLVKTDAGTLVLGGANSYTGGTSIVGGTLRISSDANLGAASGDVTLDGGTLETSANVTSARDIVVGGGTIATAADTLFTYDGLFSGTGSLAKAGVGTLLVTADNGGFGGSTSVAAGTLAVQGSLGGAVSVGAAGRLEGTGGVGSIVNAGIVAPGSSIGALTVTGDYAGNGGMLEIEVELGGDTSLADRLIVNGATSGSTRVTVTNRGGLGAQTVEGIKIVDVAGASNGSFVLDGDYLFDGEQAVIAGAYGYRLYKNGVATPQDGDWYLRSALLNAPNEPQGPLYQPGVPVYEAYVGALQSLNRLPTLQQRVGNRSWAASPIAGTGLWGRFESERQRPEAFVSTSDADRKVDRWQAQIGLDSVLAERGDGATLVGGLTAHYGKADSAVASIFGGGTIATQGYGVGATMTWYGPPGFYVDGQVKLSWFDSDLESNILGSLARGNKGDGQAFGLELGKQTPIGRNLSVTPQVQMIYAKVDFDRFADPSDAAISVARGESLKTRWGLAIDHQTRWKGRAGDTRRTRLYTVMNLAYEWLDGAVADVSGTPVANRDHRLMGELGLGGSYSWGDERFTLYTEVSGDTAIADFGAGYNLKGTAGFRVRF